MLYTTSTPLDRQESVVLFKTVVFPYIHCGKVIGFEVYVSCLQVARYEVLVLLLMGSCLSV